MGCPDIEICEDEILTLRQLCLDLVKEVRDVESTAHFSPVDWGHANMAEAFHHFATSISQRLDTHSQWLAHTSQALQDTVDSTTTCDDEISHKLDTLARTLTGWG